MYGNLLHLPKKTRKGYEHTTQTSTVALFFDWLLKVAKFQLCQKTRRPSKRLLIMSFPAFLLQARRKAYGNNTKLQKKLELPIENGIFISFMYCKHTYQYFCLHIFLYFSAYSFKQYKKFSVPQFGICIPHCEIYIPHCGFCIPQCETENLLWNLAFYIGVFERMSSSGMRFTVRKVSVWKEVLL